MCAFSADFVAFIGRLKQKGIKTVLLSGDREEAVATVADTVGIENDFVKASLSPQQKSGFISSLTAAGHHVAMVCLVMTTVLNQVLSPLHLLFLCHFLHLGF